MGQNLTGQTIASTYEDLVQISGSILTDGTGSNITNLTVTSSFATTASYALNAGVTVNTGSLMVTGSATNNVLTFTKGDGSTFNLTVDTGSAVTVNTSSLLVTASISDATITFTKGDASTFGITVNNVVNANSASVATSASYALTASYAENVTPINTGSFYVSSSVNNATVTFTQGDGTTEAVTVNNVVNATSASFATTASYALQALSASYAPSSPAFPYTGSAIISGSLIVTGSINVTGSDITIAQGSNLVTHHVKALAVNGVEILNNAGGVVSLSGAGGGTGTTFYGQINATAISASSFISSSQFVGNLNGTASHAVNADTASLAQNIVPGLSPTFTNVTVTNDLTVNGTASIAVLNYVTGSATYIGDSFVVVNTDLPAQRYAGLAVFDSGSSPQFSASLEWDGEDDIWLLKEETGNTSVILTGPTGSKGAEIFPTQNKLQKGLGYNYLGDSSITDNGTTVSINSNTEITGSLKVTGGVTASLEGTASFATSATSASYALTASFAQNVTPINTGSFYVSSSITNATITFNQGDGTTEAVTVNNVVNATSASFAITASHALNATPSGFVSGSSPNSMKNANFLVTTPATASGTGSIAIGNNARSFADFSVMIGDSTQNYDSARPNSIAIGRNASTAQNTIAIGWGATALSDSTVAIGRDTSANADFSVAIGQNANANDGGLSTKRQVAIGFDAKTRHEGEINVGRRFFFNSGSSGEIELRANSRVSGSLNASGNIATTGSYLRVSGSFSGSAIDNITDVYTTTPAIEHVVSLTQAEYNAVSASANGDTLYYITDAPSFVTSASFAATASYVLNAVSASFATTASFYSLANVDQDVVITGSVRGNVGALSISSNTASMDLSTGNFFTLTLVSGSNTYINPSNIAAGQTINLLVSTTGSGTVSFPSSVKQVSGSSYVPTTTTSKDIITFISFDNTSLYLSNVKNLV